MRDSSAEGVVAAVDNRVQYLVPSQPHRDKGKG